MPMLIRDPKSLSATWEGKWLCKYGIDALIICWGHYNMMLFVGLQGTYILKRPHHAVAHSCPASLNCGLLPLLLNVENTFFCSSMWLSSYTTGSDVGSLEASCILGCSAGPDCPGIAMPRFHLSSPSALHLWGNCSLSLSLSHIPSLPLSVSLII